MEKRTVSLPSPGMTQRAPPPYSWTRVRTLKKGAPLSSSPPGSGGVMSTAAGGGEEEEEEEEEEEPGALATTTVLPLSEGLDSSQ